MRRSRLAITALALAALNGPAHGQSSDPDAELDEENKGWREIQAEMPSYPKPENLVPLDVGKATSHRVYIDTTSLSLGEDGVMRYTAVINTAGGATNVTFEGIRCQTREQKLYAIGRGDGTWVRPRDSNWRAIVFRELAPYHAVLYREYFCPARTQPTRPQRAAEALKRGTGVRGGPATAY
jgi:hypothetical protein